MNSDKWKQDRRIGQIVHDERGSASVEWRTAPRNYERQVFEIERTSTPSRDSHLRTGFELTVEKKPASFNPYDKQGDTFRGRALDPTAAAPRSGKRDLRKLSEWIKMMRELEEKKRDDETDD